MSDWSPDSDAIPDAQGPGAPLVRVVTAHPVRLRVVRTTHDRAPAGAVVFRTLGELDLAVTAVPDDAPVLAQGALPEAMFDALESSGLLADPAPLMLEVREDGNGLSGVLYAVVPRPSLERLERVMRAGDEPWLASLDSSGEFTVGADAGTDAGADSEVPHAPFALGAIVRFAEDRRHPDSLPEEAIDLLASLLVGKAMDADKKRVELLLRSL